MKAKNTKRFQLNKITVAGLNKEELSQIKGAWDITYSCDTFGGTSDSLVHCPLPVSKLTC